MRVGGEMKGMPGSVFVQGQQARGAEGVKCGPTSLINCMQLVQLVQLICRTRAQTVNTTNISNESLFSTALLEWLLFS